MSQAHQSGQPYRLNPHLFFYLQGEDFVIWDYKRHRQWEVKRDYINALGKIAGRKSVSLSMLATFVKEGIVVRGPVEDVPWKWDIVSKIYHLSTSNIFTDKPKDRSAFIEEYLAVSKSQCNKVKAGQERAVFCDYVFDRSFGDRVDEVSLGAALRRRKTTRSFDGSSISFDNLGRLLYASCGEIHGPWDDLEAAGFVMPTKRRSFPSGGGLYPIRYLVIALHVDGIEPGVYEYIPEANGLKRMKRLELEGVYEELSACMNSQFFCEGLAAGVFFIPDFAKEWVKYPHSRSYRDVFMDIAHCSQNLLLTATAMDLRTWITAAFQDERIRDFLGIPEPCTYPAEFIGVGYGENHSLPLAFREVAVV